eukprot:12088631-Ditylum_brightwellii.AAC.1
MQVDQYCTPNSSHSRYNKNNVNKNDDDLFYKGTKIKNLHFLLLDHPESCATEQADACEVFNSVCMILSFDSDGDGKVDLLMNELCQWNRLQTEEGYKVCNAACKPSNCCSNDIDMCTLTNPDT